jgi:hypothetical protein
MVRRVKWKGGGKDGKDGEGKTKGKTGGGRIGRPMLREPMNTVLDRTGQPETRR